MSSYKLDIIDIDTERYEKLVKIFDINLKQLSLKLGFTENYLSQRIHQRLIVLKDAFVMKQHVGEELFEKGLEKLALLEIAQERNKGYAKRSLTQILRHVKELTEIVIMQNEELERVQYMLDNWDKETKPRIKIKKFTKPEFVNEYEENERAESLSDGYADYLDMIRTINQNELRDFFKELGMSKDDELAIILHYLKNNGIGEAIDVLFEKLQTVKNRNYQNSVESNVENDRNEVKNKVSNEIDTEIKTETAPESTEIKQEIDKNQSNLYDLFEEVEDE